MGKNLVENTFIHWNQESLINYAKSQIEVARHAQQQLAKSVSIIRDLDIGATAATFQQEELPKQRGTVLQDSSSLGLEAMHIPE